MNWDIVNYATSKGYFYVGRGSGANSVVAYLLRITDVDPIDLDLYFEQIEDSSIYTERIRPILTLIFHGETEKTSQLTSSSDLKMWL